MAYCIDFDKTSDPAGWLFRFDTDHPSVGLDTPNACSKEWVVMAQAEYIQVTTGYLDYVSGNSVGSTPTTPTTPATSAFTAEEVQALKYQAANPSPFNLSISEGSLVAGAVTALWATAWGLKMLRSVLSTDGEKE